MGRLWGHEKSVIHDADAVEKYGSQGVVLRFGKRRAGSAPD